MNIPLFTRFANTTIDSLEMTYLFIQMNDPNDHATINKLGQSLQTAFPDATIKLAYTSSSSSNTKISKILDNVFYGLIAITMFLCFFSLCASMSANLYEQKKEVGVIRAMGVTKYRVRLLYFYEALILVFSSCVLGVVIGTIVGYTMLLQFNLFLQSSAEMFFPWKQFLLIMVLSLFCAFFSTWGPAASLTNR